NAAELGGIGRMIELNGHDVVVARYRPKRPVATCRAVVHGSLAPQAGKKRCPSVLLVNGRIANIDRVERLQILGDKVFSGHDRLRRRIQLLDMLSVFKMRRYYRKHGAGDTGGMCARPPNASASWSPT